MDLTAPAPRTTFEVVYDPEGPGYAPKYRPRVFFTQKWIDPDGQQFGKRDLRVCTLARFTKMTHGYSLEYTLQPEAPRLAPPH